MNPLKIKTKLKVYFNKFKLSEVMGRISEVILSNRYLASYAWDFKINSENCKNFMENCSFAIGKKEFYNEKEISKVKRRAQLVKNIALISRIINLGSRFCGILKLIRFFKGDISYVVSDADTIAFKIYFVLSEDLNNNSALINELTGSYICCLKDFCPNRKNILFALQFKPALNYFSIYEPFNNVKDIDFKGNNIAKKLFSKLNIEREAFYYAKSHFLLSGKLLYSKVYKVYDIQGTKRSVVKTHQEADIFMGDNFRKVINKNFKDCDFSSLGFNLQASEKDVYIFPGQ